MAAATDRPRVLGVVALAAIAFVPHVARADDASRDAARAELRALAETDDGGFKVERIEATTAFYYQTGTGLQSQGGPIDGRGSERAWVIEPMASIRLRQSDEVVHDGYFAVDIVSAASPDSIDAVSTASRENESFTGEATTTVTTSPEFSFGARYGAHAEEQLRSVTAGPILTFRLFEDNTVFTAAATVVGDGFDDLRVNGKDKGFLSRTTFSGNFAWSQVLSPTTMFDLSLGVTEQWGTLAQTWNSVIKYRGPGESGPSIERIGERFPNTRNRNALAARLAQHVPATHTTIKGSYRFYFDENDVLAHTTEVEVNQYLTAWLVLTGRYRFHVQPAVDFWVPFVIGNQGDTPRTSDSDLEAFVAREIGFKLAFLRENAPASIQALDGFSAGYTRYFRTNGLTVDMFTLGYGRSL